ncbi:uridylyltransferase [Sesbania bispinosa]|nr:uridylyltransferase [Sesbania bispinosa]
MKTMRQPRRLCRICGFEGPENLCSQEPLSRLEQELLETNTVVENRRKLERTLHRNCYVFGISQRRSVRGRGRGNLQHLSRLRTGAFGREARRPGRSVDGVRHEAAEHRWKRVQALPAAARTVSEPKF